MPPNNWECINKSAEINELYHGQAQAAERKDPYMSKENNFPSIN
jgi:hypothetical protein